MLRVGLMEVIGSWGTITQCDIRRRGLVGRDRSEGCDLVGWIYQAPFLVFCLLAAMR